MLTAASDANFPCELAALGFLIEAPARQKRCAKASVGSRRRAPAAAESPFSSENERQWRHMTAFTSLMLACMVLQKGLGRTMSNASERSIRRASQRALRCDAPQAAASVYFSRDGNSLGGYVASPRALETPRVTPDFTHLARESALQRRTLLHVPGPGAAQRPVVIQPSEQHEGETQLRVGILSLRDRSR